MTPQERTVIEAARALAASPLSADSGLGLSLRDALAALDAPDAEQSIGWHELAEGDQLKSAKTGIFWEVISVHAMKDGYKIGIRLGGKRALITRPSPAEPEAIVRRSRTGRAVDMFVNVFSSGGK
jgi:hypothetical protein